MNERAPQPPKKDWSKVDKILEDFKGREAQKAPNTKPVHVPSKLEELTQKQNSGVQLSETDKLVLKALEDVAVETRQKQDQIMQEKARLNEILKTRPLTNDEKEVFRKLI